jgi:hypothetical protein
MGDSGAESSDTDAAAGDGAQDSAARDATASTADAAGETGALDAAAEGGAVGSDAASGADVVTTDDAALACPDAAPAVGSACQGGWFCSYTAGGACCGPAYSCSSSNTWEVVWSACACLTTEDAGNTGDDGGDAGESIDAGQLSCGSLSCAANQYCVRPTCGGGTAPPCNPVDDAGLCDAGWTFSVMCYVPGIGIGSGCSPPPCTPPAPFCADVPDASCDSEQPPTCNCLPADVCNGNGGCIDVSGHNVRCGAE